MRMISILTAALLLPLVSTGAPAGNPGVLAECGALSQAGMRECLAKKASASQASLRRAESDAAAALGRWDEDAKYAASAKRKLDASNKAFEKYRETQCAFASSLGGGAIRNALELRRLSCTIDLNNSRASALSSSIAKLPRR